MEDSMLEHTVGLKVFGTYILKPLLLFALAFGWYPAFDFVLLQVDQFIFLSPWMKELFSELKVVIGFGISVFVLVKLIIGTVKMVREKK